jgi:hypothetical protein
LNKEKYAGGAQGDDLRTFLGEFLSNLLQVEVLSRFLVVFSMQFDSEKPDKITRGACACNDDKVVFENPLNWTTRSFIFAKQREYENGHPTREPSGETIVRGRDRGKRKEAELYAPDPSYPVRRTSRPE